MEKNNNNNVLLLDIRRSLENIKNELGSHVIFIRSLFLPRRGNQYLMYIYSVMPCMYYFALCSSIWQQWRSTLGHWSIFFFFFFALSMHNNTKENHSHPYWFACSSHLRHERLSPRLECEKCFLLSRKGKKVCWSSRASCCGFRSIWKESADGTIRTRCFDLQL